MEQPSQCQHRSPREPGTLWAATAAGCAWQTEARSCPCGDSRNTERVVGARQRQRRIVGAPSGLDESFALQERLYLLWLFATHQLNYYCFRLAAVRLYAPGLCTATPGGAAAAAFICAPTLARGALYTRAPTLVVLVAVNLRLWPPRSRGESRAELSRTTATGCP